MSTPLTHNAKGQRNFIREKFIAHRKVGERLNASHYEMIVDGYPNLTLKIAATQLPGLERVLIESFGAMGVESNHQGNIKNAGEVNTSIEETIKGDTLKDLNKIIYNKEYMDITINVTPEEKAGEAIYTCELLECSLMYDNVDLANESVTELVKPAVTIRYNWADRE